MNKKILNQIDAISKTANAALQRIKALQDEIKSIENSAVVNKDKLNKKKANLSEIKNLLQSSLEDALITLGIIENGSQSVKEAIKRL